MYIYNISEFDYIIGLVLITNCELKHKPILLALNTIIKFVV